MDDDDDGGGIRDNESTAAYRERISIAREAGHSNSNQPDQIESSPHFRILTSLVNNPTSSVTVSLTTMLLLAARQLVGQRSISPHLRTTFLSLLEAAQRTPPPRQAKLVRFVAVLYNAQVVDPMSGQSIVHLRRFAWPLVPGYEDDSVSSVWRSYSNIGHDIGPVTTLRWERLAAFLAQLSIIDDIASDYMRTTLYDAQLPVDAFQQALDPIGPHATPPSVALRIASIWVRYGSERLWHNLRNHRLVHWRRKTPERVIKLTPTDWETWIKGFTDAKSWVTDETTLQMIDEAVVEMKRVMASDDQDNTPKLTTSGKIAPESNAQSTTS
ncbi:hypothetical protein PT974_04068 [Cladobotryum mycophilum]|uniref:Uncharacterized protein n=1 Tax=Cladobotryum mycophilum TaxID=491253 RepID=A0ABR0SU07_9HYPO